MREAQLIVQAGEFPMGEIIIAAAAISAAVLAAWTAERRLKITLAAQKEQHAAELLHDREMRDLDEMRRTLDEVGSHLSLVRRVGRDFLQAVSEEEEDGWKPSTEVIHTSERLSAEITAVSERYERLTLRLGRDDPLTICVGLVDEAAIEIGEASKSLPDPENRSEAVDQIDALVSAAAYYAGVFSGIARVRFASQFSDEKDPGQLLGSIREDLISRDSRQALLLLDSFERLRRGNDMGEGEQEGLKDARSP